MNIEQQLKDLIEKELPQAQAAGLKKFISQAEDIKDDLAASQRELETVSSELVKYKDDCSALRTINDELVRRHDDVKDREKAVNERERSATTREDRMDIRLAELRVEMMESNMGNMEILVGKVFGHPGVEVSTHNKTHAVDGGTTGGCGYVVGSGVTETETRIAKKGE